MSRQATPSRALVIIGIAFIAIGFGQMGGDVSFSAFVPVGIVFMILGLRKKSAK